MASTRNIPAPSSMFTRRFPALSSGRTLPSRRRGRSSFGHGNGLHHCRPELGVDSLRRVRERPSQSAPGTRSADQARPRIPTKFSPAASSDIGPVLDPTIRTAKVRIEVANPGILRLGMFVTATLLSRTTVTHASVRQAPSCICTIANGCLCPRARDNSSAWK